MHKVTNSIQNKSKPLAFTLCVLVILNLCCNSKDVSEIEEGRLQINGIEIYYKTIGEGYPTFVIHGGPGFGHDHMLQLTNLSDQYKLIFYDQRASGRSTGYADTASHTIENFIEDLEQLRLSLAPGKINIIGASWGAMIAMQYAMEYSDNINALVLLGSMGSNSEWLEEFGNNIKKNRTKADSLRMAEIKSSDEYKNRFPKARARYSRIFFRSYFYNQDLADSIKMWIADSAQEKIKGRFARIYRYFFNDYNIHDDLKRIKCPTLIVHGDADVIPVYVAEQLNEGIEKSELIILPNVGHFLWIEAPDEIYRVIDQFYQSI